MRRIAFSFAVVLFFHLNGYCQSYGLLFGSHETVLEKRTSLDISPDDSICFSKNFELGFDINYLLNHRTYFGYILRIISNGDQNIDLIYHQKSHTFRVINGEAFSTIHFSIDSPRLYNDWNRIVLKFNLENQTLSFEVNGQNAGTCNIPLNFRCFKFLWGANDFPKYKTRDIPPMQIKDIKIYENKVLKYFWPLNEVSGTTAADSVTKMIARIKNPNWIKPKYQKWELLNSFTLNGYSGVAFDPKTDKIYVTGSDSMGVFKLNTEKGLVEWVANKHVNFRIGHQDIFDTGSNKIYDFFIDQKKVVAYDFTNNQWGGDFENGKITEFWHANKFISKSDSSLYILGGYGQERYKNLVQRLPFATKKWEVLNTSGDYFPPRYLAALGQDASGKYVYIIGGYGSQTGDQMLDPRNFYDMYRYDIGEKRFKRLFGLKPVQNQFAFANSLVIDPRTNNYYGLIFPNDSSSSNLQLIKGSLTDSSFRLLGNTIPFTFHDIESFVDLYYSPISNKLITVILNYSKSDEPNKMTRVKIYSLNFSMEPYDIVAEEHPSGNNQNLLILSAIGGVILLTALSYLLYRKRRSKLSAISISPEVRETDRAVPNGLTYLQNKGEKQIYSSIFMFGEFLVTDSDGHDVTALFTPLIKELFLIISINTVRHGRGITSEMLNERLWHDKSEKDAKNNRSVNIAKLKFILEKVGNCTITKESGSWEFQILDERIYMDFRNFNSLLQNNQDPQKEDVRYLSDIIKRGSFLYLTDYDWLDRIKSEISNSVIDLCMNYIKKHDISQEPEFIIEITNCIFHFDHLNEDGLIYQCKCLVILKRFTLANNIYQKFVKEYKEIYGTEFPKSFNETIA